MYQMLSRNIKIIKYKELLDGILKEIWYYPTIIIILYKFV